MKTPNPSNPYLPNIGWPGYGPVYENIIVQQTGDHYLEPSSANKAAAHAQRRPQPANNNAARNRKL